MYYISTGTVCNFPFTFIPSKENSTDVSDCILTYAERLGADHDAFQGVVLTISSFCLLTISYRLFKLKQFARSQPHKKMIELPTFQYFFASFCFTFFLTLENIDPFAFRNWYPPQLYYIIDEFVACSLICIGIVLIDFWVRCARGIGNSRYGLPKREKQCIIIGVLINFIGWIIVGVLDPERFRLYEAIKDFFGALLLFFFLIRSAFAVHGLRKTLKSSSSSNNDADHEPNNHRNHRNMHALKVLIRKFTHFSVIILIGASALLANGFISLGFDNNFNWQWTIRFVDQYDAAQIVLKALYLLAALATLTFFKVPKQSYGEKEKSSNNLIGKKSGSIFGSFKSASLFSLTRGSNLLLNKMKHPKEVHQDSAESHGQHTLVMDDPLMISTHVRESGRFHFSINESSTNNPRYMSDPSYVS